MASSSSSLRRDGLVIALRPMRIFAGLATQDLENIADLVSVKVLGKGDYLFHEGDSSHGFYLVQKGAISVHRVSPAGKEQVIHVFRAGESFAEATLGTESGYPADARAVENSQVFLVQKSGFIELLKRQPELALRMLAAMSAHLRVIVGQLDDLTRKDVETRLVNWLLKRCPNPEVDAPTTIVLSMTKRALAAEIGTVSETLSRTLAKLRTQKLLQVDAKAIHVSSQARLSAMMEQLLSTN